MNYKCLRCSHAWKPRREEKPGICPYCKSPYWDRLPQKINKEYAEVIKEKIIAMHNRIIKVSGGENGVRDEGGVHNAASKILRYITKNYDDPASVGAFIYDDLAKRHYFFDGNKRTAHCFAKIMLIVSDYHLKLDYPTAVDFILEIARHNNPKTFKEIKLWVQKNIIKIDNKRVDIYLKEVYYDIHNKRKEG